MHVARVAALKVRHPAMSQPRRYRRRKRIGRLFLLRSNNTATHLVLSALPQKTKAYTGATPPIAIIG
jgi:hypothetical protein